ncbi:MAG TPA: ParA family protein [Clostridium sp.]
MGLLNAIKKIPEQKESLFHDAEPRIISVVAHKGGVGKTTIALNLSASLAKRGKKVLVMDLDSQNNTGLFFGVQDYIGKMPTMVDVLNQTATPDKAIIRVRDNFDLIQSSRMLGKLVMEKGMEPGVGLMLKNIMDEHSVFFSQYDYIFFDCSPSHSILHLNALLASNTSFIPLLCDFFSVNGVTQIQQTIDEVNQNIDLLKEYDPDGIYHHMKIGLIILNMLDRRMRSRTDKAMDIIKETYPQKLSTIPIRVCSQLSDCPEKHLLIGELAPHSSGSEDFDLLAEEVLNLV